MGYVLDTSALMRLLLDEPGAEEVQRIVEGDEPVALSVSILMEVQYVLLRRLPPLRVDKMVTTLRAWPVEIVESDPAWGRQAALVKSRGGLSLGDAWIAALALQRDATLVHRDPEFDSVPGLRSHRLDPTPTRAS